MMYSRILFLSLPMLCCAALAVHTSAISPILADDAAAAGALEEEAAVGNAYLGLRVGPVPEVLSMHLPELLGASGGVLVFAIDPDSPAAEAGLQTNDVLVRFDFQNVWSDDTLVDLLRDAKVGQKVELNLIRQGKPVVEHVTLGKRPANMPENNPLGGMPQMPDFAVPNFGNPDFGAMPNNHGFADMQKAMEEMNEKMRKMHEEFHQGFGAMPAMPAMPGMPPMPAMPPMPGMPGFDPDDFSSWTQSSLSSHFTSIQINKLDGDQYRASVKYQTDDGEVRDLEIDGTLEEIRDAADADPNMPESVRKQLQQSLNMRGFDPFPNGQSFDEMQKMHERMMQQFNQGIDLDDVELPRMPDGNLKNL